MKKRRVLLQLYLSYLVISFLSLLAITWFASRSLASVSTRQSRAYLSSIASLIAAQLDEGMLAHYELIPPSLGMVESDTRVVIRLHSKNGQWFEGKMITGRMQRGEGEVPGPEIGEAFAGSPVFTTRFQHGRRLLVHARPLTNQSGIYGVIEVVAPTDLGGISIVESYVRLALAGCLAALTAAVASFLIYIRITKPLEELKRGAERFSRGDLNFRLAVPEEDDFAGLALALNDMSHQLSDRMRTVMRQSNEQSAILSSMAEGVVVIDPRGTVTRLNEAATRFLGTASVNGEGRPLEEVVTNEALRAFISDALGGGSQTECTVSLYEPDEKHLQVYARNLRESDEHSSGLLVVINDITRLRKLEQIRKDFVANVSHELKTPITSIKGFVETLLDGALEDRETADRFLGIIAKQADRLNAIFEDLLSLSRLEQDRSDAEILLQPGRLREVVHSAIQLCQVKAAEKNIELRSDCPIEIMVLMNPNLLEQLIVNLIDNGVKYTDSGGTVTVAARRHARGVVLSVTDSGCGIDRQHLDRLFERFYRVDQARSRKQGGTGLGLSIVKHIAQLHGGQAVVESTPGKGSVFSIQLQVPA